MSTPTDFGTEGLLLSIGCRGYIVQKTSDTSLESSTSTEFLNAAQILSLEPSIAELSCIVQQFGSRNKPRCWSIA